MVFTTQDWNNDLGDEEVETDFFDDDTNREEVKVEIEKL